MLNCLLTSLPPNSVYFSIYGGVALARLHFSCVGGIFVCIQIPHSPQFVLRIAIDAMALET